MNLAWLMALVVAAGPAWAQERDGDRPQEGEKREEPAPRRREADREAPPRREGDRRQEGERKEGERPVQRDGERPAPREGDRPRDGERPVQREGQRREGERPVQRDGERPVPREGDRPRAEGERPPVREGDRPRDGERREGERPVQRDGDRPREGAREGDRPRDGERREANPRPARGEVVPPAPVESPIPVDDRVVPKTETPPSFVGRVVSVFKDGVNTLLSLKVPGRTPTECSIQLQPGTVVSYVGLEKPQEVPTAGYLVYVWMKPGSTDVAAAARFTPESKK